MTRIDAHAHGGTADRDASGKPHPPLRIAWEPGEMTPEDYIKLGMEKYGLEKALVLDAPEVTFQLKKIFGDYVMAAPKVDMDNATPEMIDALFRQGAVGIKFIAPAKSYGDDSYFPLYDAIRANRGLAVFHTGFVILGSYEPGGVMGRHHIVDIAHMRPAALDRVSRAFPDLKILMAHFGNPWWEEAWKMISSHKNIYADFSGGTAYRRSMNMWAEIFAPNDKLDVTAVSKLCFGTDGGSFTPGHYGPPEIFLFYDALFERLNLSEELREKINRGNILQLVACE